MDQLLVALDVDRAAEAERLTQELAGVAGGFKIGSRLFTAEGPQFVRRLTERGVRVFLDLKFHDIPNTVAEAVTEATRLGVWMMTIHTSGGAAMMQAAAHAARDTASLIGVSPPHVVGVTGPDQPGCYGFARAGNLARRPHSRGGHGEAGRAGWN